MEKRILLSVFVAGLLVLGITGGGIAGVEPAPWEPEINKLHSIELNIAAIEKRLVKLDGDETLPPGTVNYLNAMENKLGVLDTRLADTLYLLPPYDQLDTETRGEVFISLDAIRTDASGMIDIFSSIAKRMGIEPSPWREILNSIVGRINGYIRPTDTLPK
ncbi:MAG: hypothetical protein HXY44_15785 [Syntrophaceae bacterium]|nr:hypothetical protein [Syntrophaceae bacterium]